MGHVEKVQQIYAAFERRNISGILKHLDENVEWEYAIEPTDVPWLQQLRGRTEVPRFFESLKTLEFHQFQPKTFLERGNVVVVLIDVDLTVKATGRRIVEEDEVHIWHFNSEGRVIKFGHKLDTHQHWKAYRGGFI